MVVVVLAALLERTRTWMLMGVIGRGDHGIERDLDGLGHGRGARADRVAPEAIEPILRAVAIPPRVERAADDRIAFAERRADDHR